eukprot:TRINITY_DN25655_c0_g1_i1.p1 TRINITY_DN25655_c0_g1~~TRINITY_DN25655_c0_g1_i1.p1  ORF type:complete len:472 (-),score=39.81 TRINITY_DN25655_c0_g1_i1:127-1542(-)
MRWSVTWPCIVASVASDLRLDGGASGWDEQAWRVQVDGVMGGKSTGALRFQNNALVFTGTINLAGGGFSSIRRSMTTHDLSRFAGVLVEMETQQFVPSQAPLGLHLQLHDSKSYWGFAAAFAVPVSQTAAETARVFLPLAAFDRGSRSGSSCTSCSLDVTAINGADVYVLFQEGPFQVRLRSITAVQQSQVPVTPTVQIDSADVVKAHVTATIQSGAYVYNKGYRELCIAIYASTLRTLVASQGASDTVKGVACAGLRAELNAGVAGLSTSKSERAWLLRQTLDALLADLGAGNSRKAWLPTDQAAAEGLEACQAELQAQGNSSGGGSTPPGLAHSGQTSSVTSFLSFLGPFSGMGISGYNDLGQFTVGSAAECADRCLALPRCRSFDHGARGQIEGQCWLSTANRASAGSAYTTWTMYDYYERQETGLMQQPFQQGADSSRGQSAYASASASQTIVLIYMVAAMLQDMER